MANSVTHKKTAAWQIALTCMAYFMLSEVIAITNVRSDDSM